MKKILIVNTLVLFLALAVGGGTAHAIDYKGVADKLEIQLAKIEVSQDGGNTWTTVWTGTSTTLDCATGELKALVKGIQMAPGDYNGIRLSFHNSVERGALTVDPAGNFTWTDTSTDETRYYYTALFVADASNYTTDATGGWGVARGLAEDITIDTSGSTMAIYQSEPAIFTISPNQTTTIEIEFHMIDALNYTVATLDGAIVWQDFTWGLPAGFHVTVK